jgi:hypothetical protein
MTEDLDVTGTNTAATSEPEGVTTGETGSVEAPTPEIPPEANSVQKPAIAAPQWIKAIAGRVNPPVVAYLKQWPKTFVVWFLLLLCLSLLVWNFLPGDVAISGYTPAQGLFIPITVFGGPLIIAIFIATHGGLKWYSNTVAVKGIGLRLIDTFFKFTTWLGNISPFSGHPGKEDNSAQSGIADLSFPGLGLQGFLDRYIEPDRTTSAAILETVSRYQLQNLGQIAINFFIVYVLVKLPAIVLWEVLSLTLEWSVYKLGFSLFRVPFPPLTIYHWELFLVENIAVAVVIFFQEVRLDTAKTSHIKEKKKVTETLAEGTEG